jgi:acyl-CoA reductase-like NAD-dependent aldehyde dehydrogenase
MTATWKVAPCLAFGNTAVLKMSEPSPLTAARLGELALEAGIPAGVLNIVHGFGAEAGEPLCAHPGVRAISFTGSTATGQRIVRAAGLKKFSIELGGKSPVDRLSQALIAALNSTPVKARFQTLGTEPPPGTAAEMARFARAERDAGAADPAAGPEDGLSDGSRAPFAAST